MNSSIRLFAATVAALTLTGGLMAQVVPGSGSVDHAEQPVAVTPPTHVETPLPAETILQGDQTWAVVSVYGWIPGMKGTVGAGRRTAQVNLSVSDALNLVDDIQGVATLHMEVGRGDWGLITDLLYMNLVPVDDRLRVSTTATFFEFLGMYRLINTGIPKQQGHLMLDVLAGGRLYYLTNSVSLNAFDPFAAERSQRWVDLVVGARVGMLVTDRLGLWARGDVGGFGIGNSSQQACNAILGFDYRCTDCMSFSGGYRWLKIDKSSGRPGQDAFLLDATLAGPFMALTFRF